MVLFTKWPSSVQSYLSSSDPPYVPAVQVGFSALLCSSAILTLESSSPIFILSQWWQQHVTQSHVVMFFFSFYYVCFFSFASQEYFSFSVFFFFLCFCLTMGTCEHFLFCLSLYADTMYLMSLRLSQC